MRSRTRWLTAVRWTTLLAATADLIGLKAGWLTHSPNILAVLFGAAVVAFGARFVMLVAELRKPERRAASLAAALGSAGILVGLLGGTANWLLGLQGFVILSEGESVRLHGGSELQDFRAGPLADIEEMRLTLVLDELELVPEGPDAFRPTSHLLVQRGHEGAARLDVERGGATAHGPLWFFQGAFGFAPRIVILEGNEPTRTVFDRVVPFTTERRGPSSLSFEGSFTVRDEGLRVVGRVDLASLDEGMRGHATLELEVLRDGESLGRGRLLPGHFADIDDGFRIGFAGLEKWSEIVVSRRNYGRIVLGGTVIAVVAGGLWLVAVWRGR